MSRISEINPAHAPEAIQKIIADHVSDGHALTVEKRTLRTHPWQEPEQEAALEEIAAYCRRTGAYFNNQAANPANPEAHYRPTGPEIWQDTEKNLDVLVCMAGTGGTGFGTARYLRE